MKLRHLIPILGIGLVFSLLVLFRSGHVNGFPAITHWAWHWRNLGTQRTLIAFAVPFLTLSGVLLCIERQALPKAAILLPVLVLCSFSLQILGMSVEPEGFERIRQLVLSGNSCGYHTDALAIQDLPNWLRSFHVLDLSGHASTHPAGPILFYYAFSRIFSPNSAPLVAACAIGLIASGGVLMMYRFAGLWTEDRHMRLIACTLYALLPAIVVFFPEFDQILPIFSMLIVLCWVKALDGSWLYAAALGVVFAVAAFFAYNLLAMGAFLVAYAFCSSRRWMKVLTRGAIALASTVLLYLLLWAVTGYNVIAAFAHSWSNQQLMASHLNRPYAIFTIFDLYDFALGGGILALLIMLAGITRRTPRLTLACLATILIIDLSGLLRGETARVWLFLQPLVIVPAAIELARCTWPWRVAVFTLQGWILLCLKAKMAFVEP